MAVTLGEDGQMPTADARVDAAAALTPPPTWLRTPPSGHAPPPIETKPAVLPLGELPWPDVERLLLRLAERRGQAEFGQLFGTAGQEQEGIDLYVRHAKTLAAAGPPDPRRYTTLQSRRVQRLTPKQITDAIDDFLAGSWAGRSSHFIYATTHSLKPTQLADEINEQAGRLEELKITFVPWGLEEISEELRQQPDLVDDFFGRHWVGVFCGDDVAQALGNRLHGPGVAHLRRSLSTLYAAVFSTQDSGFALLPRSPVHPADRDRFVLLDVAPDDTATSLTGTALSPRADRTTVEDGPANHASAVSDPMAAVAVAQQQRYPRRARPAALDQALQRRRVAADLGWLDVPESRRTPADAWLAGTDLAVLNGPAGSGKSTLLRFLVTDLLSDTPTSAPLAARFGHRLPVWLPFAFLCTHLAEGSDHSVTSATKAWLARQSAEHLWPLVEAALRDDRLLLVVDGLDEWTDPRAAEHALGLLEAFVQGRPVACVVSTRPYALLRLPILAGWQIGRLAPLTASQRRALARAALKITLGSTWAADASGGAEHAEASNDAAGGAAPDDRERAMAGVVDPFLAELGRTPDLDELAGIPLFLLLLASVWSGQAVPPRRFAAYARLVDLLLERHPAIRRRAAPLPSADIAPDDVRRILAATAYRLRTTEPSLAVPVDQMRNALVEAMRDETVLALDLPTARSLATQVLDIAEGQLGVLVRHGAGTVGFLHRTIAEQLAAEHLSRLPVPELQAVIGSRIGDRAWRDILLAMLTLQNRPTDVATLLNAAIAGHREDSLPLLGGYELLAEALAVGVRPPPKDVHRYVAALRERVETYPWLPHRVRLLAALTAALAVPAVRNLLQPAFSGWVLAKTPDPAPGLWALRRPGVVVDSATELLAWGLRHPDDHVNRIAAKAAAQRFGGTADMRDTIIGLARRASTAAIQAAALEALIAGWPDHDATRELIMWARRQHALPLRAVSLQAAHQTDSEPAYPAWTETERAWLLSLLERDDRNSGEWETLISDLVAVAARGDDAIRDRCLQILTDADGDRELAFHVLASTFPADPKFVDWAAHRLIDDVVFPGFYGLTMVPENWANIPAIRAAAEARLTDGKINDLPQKLAAIAQFAPTPKVRDRLIQALDDDWAPWWAGRALLRDHADDPTAHAALVDKLTGPAEHAAPLAYLAIDVLGVQRTVPLLIDLVRARTKHAEIAAGALAHAWHACVEAVDDTQQSDPPLPGHRTPIDPEHARAVLHRHDPDELAAMCLDAMPHDDHVDDGWIIVAWPDDPDVAERARLALTRKQPPLGAVVSAYGTRTNPGARRLVDTAVALLGFLEPDLRTLAAQQLARPGIDPALVVDLLGDWPRDSHPDVRRSSAVALTQVLLAAVPATSRPAEKAPAGSTDDEAAGSAWRLVSALADLRERCRRQMGAYGPEHDEDRRIAWILMLLLDEPGLLDGVTETRGNPEPVSVELMDAFGDTDPLLADLIAAHWQQLIERHGPGLLQRLSGRRAANPIEATHAVRRTWAALATVAARHPHLDAALRDAVEEDPALLHHDQVLAWYAAGHRGQPDLLRHIGDAITAHHTNDKPFGLALLSDPAITPATDDQIQALLLEGVPVPGPELNEAADDELDHYIWGWQRIAFAQRLPTAPYTASLYRCLQKRLDEQQTRGWGWADAIAVTIASAPAPDLPVLILRLLTTLVARGATYFAVQLLDAVARRVRRDPDGEDALVAAILHPDDLHQDNPMWAPQKITNSLHPAAAAARQVLFATMLAAAVALRPEVLDALVALHDAPNDEIPDVLADTAVITDRTIPLALLALLDSAL